MRYQLKNTFVKRTLLTAGTACEDRLGHSAEAEQSSHAGRSFSTLLSWQRARPAPMGKAATRPVAAATTAAATRPADSARARRAGPDPTAQKVWVLGPGSGSNRRLRGSRAGPHLPLCVFSPRMPCWVLRSRLPAAVPVSERGHVQQD